MIAVAYYLLKVTLCSGLLFGYYQFALRNRLFHQWNRFYLLSAVILSIVLPLISFSILSPKQNYSAIYHALQVVSVAYEMAADYHPFSGSLPGAYGVPVFFYALVSMVMAIVFGTALQKIRSMTRRHVVHRWEDIFFVNTREPGTPFSFLRYIFWNADIDLECPEGRRIFSHEMVHVREKHTIDKLFLQIVLIFYWINPFFWLVRNELKMIHEFIADKKSVGQGNSELFTAMVLHTAYPGYHHQFTSPFFQHSIKRRLNMITMKNNPRISYLGRILAIPFITLILLAFTLKSSNLYEGPLTAPAGNARLNKAVTVVIDAGHGGEDAGATGDGILEKDITLRLAKLVKSQNRNGNISIVLSRESDVKMPLAERVEMVSREHADLFISLHLDAEPGSGAGGKSGFDAIISAGNPAQSSQNVRLATILLNNLSPVYSADREIHSTKQGVYVLDKNPVPAVILQCGYITNAADRTFISSEMNRQKIAEGILRSIEGYFSDGVRIDTPSGTAELTVKTDTLIIPKNSKAEPLVFVDGKESSTAQLNKLDPQRISRMDVLKDSAAILKYGEKGRNGVILVQLKK